MPFLLQGSQNFATAEGVIQIWPEFTCLRILENSFENPETRKIQMKIMRALQWPGLSEFLLLSSIQPFKSSNQDHLFTTCPTCLAAPARGTQGGSSLVRLRATVWRWPGFICHTTGICPGLNLHCSQA